LKILPVFSAATLCLFADANAAFAQGVTGQISGTLADPAATVVAGATVTLTDAVSHQQRRFATDRRRL
jgi:hypothetical protein